MSSWRVNAGHIGRVGSITLFSVTVSFLVLLTLTSSSLGIAAVANQHRTLLQIIFLMIRIGSILSGGLSLFGYARDAVIGGILSAITYGLTFFLLAFPE